MGPITEDLLQHRLPDACTSVRSPWVNFEAGAVAKAVGGRAHVSPLLLGLSPGDLDGAPLAMFQCTEFTRPDVERLVNAINEVAAKPMPESQVSLRFAPRVGDPPR